MYELFIFSVSVRTYRDLALRMEDKAPRRYAFGGFVLDAREKTLTKGSRQVSITPKALEILIILVEDAGHLVSKEDLFQKVWAESFVEDANLTHHISRLRRALEESDENKFIETLPKRGYRFVAEIRQVSDPGFPIADRKTERQLENNEANRSATEKPFLRPWFASAKTFPVLLGLVLIILVSAVVVWFNVRDPGERSLHDPRLTLPNQSAIVRITNSGKVGAATISPDGKFVAYIQNYTLGEGMLYVRQVETNTEAKLLAPEERVFGSISFSPDSAFVYYITYDKRDPGGALYRIPVLGGQPTRVLANVKFMFSLSPDGKRAAFYRFDAQQKQTSIVHAALDGNNDEKTVLTFNDAEKTITSVPAFSPDGRFISFGLADAATGMYYDAPQFSLFAADLQSGEIKSLTGEKWSEIGKTNWMPDGSGLVFVASRPRIGSQIYFLSYPGGDLHRLTNELNTYGNYGMG